MERADVVVVGAGPAGTAAAISVARAGREVVLVDKARFPRDKCCGDGLTTLALRELEALGLRPEAIPSWTWVDAAWLRSPSGRTVELPLPSAGAWHAAIARRSEFDAALVDLARHEGAKVLDGHAVTAVDVSDPRVVELAIDGHVGLAANHVIAADGMWSPVKKALGLTEPGELGEWHAFRQYITGVTGSAAHRLWVWFEPELLPGYAWSFPLGGGTVNVGFGILRAAGTPTGHMKAQWEELLGREHIVEALGAGSTAEGPHKAWPIPTHVDRAPLARGRVLFVGDAAAATDPLTGEGIGQALLTGRLAGEAIGTAARPEAIAAMYERTVARALFADHRMSLLLGRVLSRERGARGAVRFAGLTPWTRRNFARWLFEDEPRAGLLTPRRWHRQFLSRPGAYAGR
jgi:menaquinone-9 beta-reductase